MSRAVTLANIASGEAFSVDETNNRVGIASTIPDATLDIKNTILMDGDAGVITATSFSGSGANLTALSGTNIASGTVAAARVATLNQNTTGTSAGLTGTPSITVQDIIAVGATFSGVLTYEDVTNIDAIGVVTARAGVDITGGTLGLSLGTGATAFSPASNTLTLGTNNTEKLRIASDGDLTLTGDDNVEIKMKCGTSSGNNTLAFLNSGGTTRGNITYDSDNDFLLFNVNQSERLRITNAGNVGIATNAPIRPLVIAKDSASSIIELKRTNTNTTGSVGALSWTAMDGHCVSTIYVEGDGDNEGGNLVFKTTTAAADNSPYDASLLERLKITSIGDVEFSGTATGVSSVTWDASANSLIFKDESKSIYGDDSDLSIYRSATSSWVHHSGSGYLFIQGNDIALRSTGQENYIVCDADNFVKLYYDGSERLATTATGVSIANTCSDAIGDVRSVPLQDESGGAYILAVSDKGQCVHCHSSTTAVTVNINTFAAGDVVSIVNGDTGTVAITQGTSFALRNTADSSTGSKTLASFGMATIWFSGHNVGYISGSGLS